MKMKKLSKLKLSVLSNTELEKREMNKLTGGLRCCICGCHLASALDLGNTGNFSGYENPGGGYGSGAYS